MDPSPYNPWAAPLFPQGAAFGTGSPAEDAQRKPGIVDNLLSHIAGALGRGFMAPGNALNSPTPLTSEQMIAPAMDMATLATGGAGVVPAEANSLRMGIKAYHGSPHDFDRFDLSKIGTGEGAQAYGHGLYFAENPAVAGAYRNLAAPPGPLPAEVRVAVNQLDNLGFDSPGQAMSVIRSDPNWMKKWDVDPTRSTREAEAAAKVQKYIEENPRGHGYEVNINADPAHFLDWDKPLSQQSDLFGRLKDSGIINDKSPPHQISGQATPKALFQMPVDKGSIEGRVADLGIPGIKYLDQGSRGAGQGSSNYVVFNDKLIDILRKYGLAGFAAPPIFAQAAGENKQ